MKRSSLLMLLWLLGIVSLKAQSISKAEYFFDSDPGVGKGTALSVTASGAISATYSVNTNLLTAGMHKVFVRFGFNTGEWGPSQGDIFYVDAHPFDTAVKIQAIEYFYDKDPGAGKGTTVALTPSSTISTNVNLSTTSLTNGWHNAYLRCQYSNGEYGFFTGTSFVIQKNTTPILNAGITKIEYYVDYVTFFGNGNNFNIPFSPVRVDSVTVSDSIKFDSSLVGDHYITVQAKNAYGVWSKDTTRMFTIKSNVGIESASHAGEMITMYPNPVKDNLYLSGTMKNIQLADMNGKILLSFNAPHQNEKLDLSVLHSGVYILRIFTGDAVKIKKVVKE